MLVSPDERPGSPTPGSSVPTVTHRVDSMTSIHRRTAGYLSANACRLRGATRGGSAATGGT
jgi:hypothetical protein